MRRIGDELRLTLELPAQALGLPAWAGWTAPLAVVWAWGLAALSWRLGVRHYQGGGG